MHAPTSLGFDIKDSMLPTEVLSDSQHIQNNMNKQNISQLIIISFVDSMLPTEVLSDSQHIINNTNKQNISQSIIISFVNTTKIKLL